MEAVEAARWCPFTAPAPGERLGPEGVCLQGGCMAWTGEACLRMPPVRSAIPSAAQGQSLFERWLDERIEVDPSAYVASYDLYADYLAFVAARGGERPLTQTTFGRALNDHGVVGGGKSSTGHKLRRGARLRPKVPEPADRAPVSPPPPPAFGNLG